jgi:predicted short-subunit dehydrogenase-like oxidoreductase (DUF2520 family)
MKKIVFLGAGNLATHLAIRFHEKGFNISQVFSRTKKSAKELADKIGASFSTSLDNVEKDAGLYICALKDDALPDVLEQLPQLDGTIVHTAGSIDMSIFEGKFSSYGVFYPLQTFSKSKTVDFSKIPIFLEASDKQTLAELEKIAEKISEKVYTADSNQRKILHLSAVFACNFVNHLYALADDIVGKAGFDFNILLPLIDETAEKIHYITPREAQTGPAVRNDKSVIEKQLTLLGNDEAKKQIYKILSKSISNSAFNIEN